MYLDFRNWPARDGNPGKAVTPQFLGFELLMKTREFTATLANLIC